MDFYEKKHRGELYIATASETNSECCQSVVRRDLYFGRRNLDWRKDFEISDSEQMTDRPYQGERYTYSHGFT